MNLKIAAALVLTLAAAAARGAEPVAITVHSGQTTRTIDKRIYGQFLEHIFNSVHGGLWGDQVLNGTLEGRNAQAATPIGWEITSPDEVKIDKENPFNADTSVRIAAKLGGDSATGPGIRQRNIALRQGEKYELSLYLRGERGSASVAFSDGSGAFFTKSFSGLTAEWQKFSVEFTADKTVDNATLTIGSPPSAPVNVDQISLFSASAKATGGYRPDLLKAVSDLQPATIRWPGGSFANNYDWQNGIGPREKRVPHPVEQWGDRDPYQFGTDEFMQLCEKLGSEPIIVLNTARGVDDALHWLEYCMGDATTEFGKLRATNGHAAPYKLNTIEIDNEPWLLMEYPKYLEIVNRFCPAIRAKYPQLKLSVAGGYAFDTGPGEGNGARGVANTNWDPRIIDQAGKMFDVLSPHYYNGLLAQHPADYREDPFEYEEFLRGRGDLIAKSANPNIKIYVSEWNLTKGPNDWRMGLYAGGILNAFEREGDLVKMSCPALFMRKIGVTNSWDNALINFDQKSWFPAGNYVVMKLWREAYAPSLLAVEGPARPLNYVATRSEDRKTVFFKVVNPESTETQITVNIDGDLVPRAATLDVVAPGAENIRNSIDQPDRIKAAPGQANLQRKTVKFTMPAWSAGVVRVSQ
jgi:alpha-N-arabinofuranosidase